MDSPGGLINARLRADGLVSVAMGVPNFDPRSLPFEAEREAPSYRSSCRRPGRDRRRIHRQSARRDPRALGGDAPVDTVGPAMENHPRFPRRVNVGFMEVVAPDHIRLRVFERGAGETQACGTGACGAVAVGRRHGLLAEEVKVDLPGGRLVVQWRARRADLAHRPGRNGLRGPGGDTGRSRGEQP